MALKITRRQQAVLDCIEDCVRDKGYGQIGRRSGYPRPLPCTCT